MDDASSTSSLTEHVSHISACFSSGSLSDHTSCDHTCSTPSTLCFREISDTIDNLDASLRARHVGWLWQQRAMAAEQCPGLVPTSLVPTRVPPRASSHSSKRWMDVASTSLHRSASLSEAAAEVEAAAVEVVAKKNVVFSRSPYEATEAPYGQHMLRRTACKGSPGTSPSRRQQQQQETDIIDWIGRTGLSRSRIESMSKSLLLSMILAESPGFQGYEAFEAVAAWAETDIKGRGKDACDILANVDFSPFTKTQIIRARQTRLVQSIASLQARVIKAGGAEFSLPMHRIYSI